MIRKLIEATTKDKVSYNNLPEEVYKFIPEPPKKGMVEFRLKRVRKDPHPLGGGEWLVPNMHVIPSQTQITYNGELYNIGNIVRNTTSGPVFDDIIFTKTMAGRVILNTKRDPDMRVYTFLMLHQACEQNPFRETDEDPIFELVNDEKVAASQVHEQSQLATVIDRIVTMSAEEIRTLATIRDVNVDPRQPVAVLQNNIIKWAKDNVEEFKSWDSYLFKEGTAYPIVKRAMLHGHISYEGKLGSFKLKDTKEVVYSGDKALDMEKNVKKFSHWLMNNDDGSLILDILKEKLKGHEKEYAA
jgi:hypothetical protein